jgi:hypothetical protein
MRDKKGGQDWLNKIILLPVFVLAGILIFSVPAQAKDIVWDNSEVRVINRFELNRWDRLIIQPGTIIKISAGGSIISYGNIIATGNADNPIVFTSLKDDSVGGDTNNDNDATAPAMGDWGYFLIQGEGAQITMDYVEIHYGGGSDKRTTSFISVSNFGEQLTKLKEINITHSSIINNFGSISIVGEAIFKISESNFYNDINCPLPKDWDPIWLRCDKLSISKGGTIAIEAPYVYWGHAEGPTTLDDYSKGIKKGTRAFVNVNYQPFLIEPWPSNLTEKKIKPVIIVPGIISSYLNKNEPDLPEAWPNILKMSVPGDDSYLYDLSLNQSGWPDEVNIKPTDIFRTVANQDVFSGLIEELEKAGYKENENLFVFPYDWRLAVRWIAGDSPLPNTATLKNKIAEVLTSTGADKVNIIAHSMGGLVAKTYMQMYGQDKIDTFIDIGTPHYGSPKALKMLMFGDDMGFSYKVIEANPITIKNISQNMPSVFDLLPSRAYQDIKFFSAPDIDYSFYIADAYDFDKNNVKGNLDYNASQEFMENIGLNTTLLANANNLHTDIDNFNFDKTYNISGCGTPTIGKIYIINQEESGGYEYGLKYIDGDGTVPLKSADALNTSQRYYAKGAEHGVLSSSSGIKQLVASILSDNKNQFNLSDYQNLKDTGVNCGISGTEISYHSPINIHIYDEFGNHAGPDSNNEIENNIAGVSYDIIGGNKFIFLPAGRDFNIAGQATAAGSFNARIQTIKDDQYTGEAYFNAIPLTANTKITMDNTERIIKYDGNGDGQTDQIISPSSVLDAEEMQDIDEPETKINVAGTVGNNNWYISPATIVLAAEDNEGGSGILKTEYKINNEAWQDYAGPVNISEGSHNILYKSTDKAGNVEEDKNLLLKIDISAPEITDIFPNADTPVLHSEIIPLLYNINDNISGIATDTVKVMIDGAEIKNNQLDLFNYKIGEHQIEIIAEDLAGNKATATEIMNITANYDSVIKDINRLYFNHDIIKDNTRSNLIKDIEKLEQAAAKYQEKITDKKIFFKTAYDKCSAKHKKEKCDKLAEAFDRIFFRAEIKYDHKIEKLIEEIFDDLNKYRKKNWINEFGYAIIKDNINFIKENL